MRREGLTSARGSLWYWNSDEGATSADLKIRPLTEGEQSSHGCTCAPIAMGPNAGRLCEFDKAKTHLLEHRLMSIRSSVRSLPPQLPSLCDRSLRAGQEARANNHSRGGVHQRAAVATQHIDRIEPGKSLFLRPRCLSCVCTAVPAFGVVRKAARFYTVVASAIA